MGERPCPYVGCRYHLYLETQGSTIKINYPNRESWDIPESCTLDVADKDGLTLEQVGKILWITRERVRQIENRSLVKLKLRPPDR